MVNAAYTFTDKSASAAVGKTGSQAQKSESAFSKSSETFAKKLDRASEAKDGGKRLKAERRASVGENAPNKDDGSVISVSENESDVSEVSIENTDRPEASESVSKNDFVPEISEESVMQKNPDSDDLKKFLSDVVDIMMFMAQLFNMPPARMAETISELDMGLNEVMTGEGIKKIVITVNNGKNDVEFLLNPEMAKQLKEAVEFMAQFSADEIEYIMNFKEQTDGINDSIWKHIAEAAGEAGQERETLIEKLCEVIYGKGAEDSVPKTDIPEDKASEMIMPENPGKETDGEKVTDYSQTADVLESKEGSDAVDARGDGNTSEESMDFAKDRKEGKVIAEPKITAGFMENIRTSVAEALGDNITDVRAYDRADSIMRQIIDQVSVTSRENMSSIEISLTPESLGKVEVHLVSKDGAVTAQISVESEAARKAVESQIMTLRETFGERDIKIDAVEVTIASHHYENNGNRDGRDGRGQVKKNVRRILNGKDFSEDEASAEAARDETDMIMQGSTISYSA